MPGFDRASILQGAGDMIFNMVCHRSTPEQWAEWLRAPLEHAAGTANHDLVRKLLKAGADGSAGWKGCYGKTLLHAAAEGGNEDVITALCTAGAEADMNAKSPDTAGRTPLHVAILGGKEAAAGALIMAGADVNILDANGDAPLHLAIKGGHSGVAKDLLLSGADLTVMDSMGDPPIHLAARYGQDEVVMALARKGANVDRVDTADYRTPLAVAVLEDRVSTVGILLAAGANANLREGYDCETVLHIAAQFNKVASIPALIEAGANIEARDVYGDAPLFYAARGSCAAMLALLHLGADVNSTSDDGSTPLHAACLVGKVDIADLLLRWGADETIVDRSGKTPNHLIPDIAQASEQDRPELERLTKLLAHAPQDRVWRRRGFIMMCRAHPDRLRLVGEISDSSPAEAVEQQQQQSPGDRDTRGHVEAEVEMGAHGGSRGNVCASRRAGGEGASGGFDGVAAWFVAVNDGDVVSNIVGFL